MLIIGLTQQIAQELNGAVALNMSWGSDTVLADDIQNYMSDNSVDAAYSVAYHLTNSLGTDLRFRLCKHLGYCNE